MASDDEFDSSPRPVKKRRVNGAAKKAASTTIKKTAKSRTTVTDDLDDIIVSDDDAPVVKPKRGRPKKAAVKDIGDDDSVTSATSKKTARGRPNSKSVEADFEHEVVNPRKTATRKKRQSTVFDSDEDGSVASAHSRKTKGKNRNTIDDFDQDGFAKPQKPKPNIYIPAQGELKDQYIDADAPPPSTNPWEIRGAIWRKDTDAPKSVFDTVPARPNPPAFGQTQEGPLVGDSKATTVRTSTSNSAPQVRPALARFMAPSPAKQSDIPDSDDLDPEDWAQFDEQYVQSSVSHRSGAPKVLSTKEPPRQSALAGLCNPQPKSIPRPTLPRDTEPIEDSIEDSILIDDLDPEDWALLESNDVVSLKQKPTECQPRPAVAMSSRPVIRDQTTNLAQAPKSGPFIEIEDDSMDEDDLSENPPHPNCQNERANSGLSTIRNISTIPSAVQQPTGTQNLVRSTSIVDELADLPSDAFDSDMSSPIQLRNETTHISTQAQSAQARNRNLVAPKNGLVQTTLYGGKARPEDAAAVASKKHNWPLATQQEVATHHRLDQDAIKTWIYPTNLGTIRDYQYNIVARGLFHNLLIALPTGLGKTFIAATIMLNWFRWAPDSKIVFVAPTKPLVSQQIDACFHIAGIPRSETVLLTGETKPAIRAEEWKEKRVFFMTPQTIMNDLKHGYCDPKRIVLIVVDEAHRATGGYSYVEVIKFLRRFNQSFRVLALTATPGSTVEAVQQVIDGLDIARVEIRTETSIDIRQYVHARDIDIMKFDASDELNMIMELLSKAIQPVLTKLNGQNAYWLKDPMKLTAYGCTLAQKKWSQSEAGRRAPHSVKGMIASIFPVLASLAHGISLLKFHGIGPFYRSMINFRNEVDGGQTKSKYAKQIREDQNFNKMMGTVQTWTRNPDFLGHPKLEYLRSVVLNHFMDSKDTSTRIMIFAHWRDSAEEIVRVMKRNEPMIRPHVFVGQAASKGSEGMNQTKQGDVIEKFKNGTYNTLVATSIGEEGLDIGEVDLIVCYDASSSPIRMLQRMGRTGRKRRGNIVLLLMRGKEDTDFEQAKDNYEKMQAMISEGTRFEFHEDKSHRIIPRGVNPVVDKRVVEIPVENSQAELPEPNRRKRVPKKPPKKFHMPDNVRTGFVTASRIDESDEEEDTVRPKAKGRPKKAAAAAPVRKTKEPTPEPEAVPLPFLNDVLLNKVQERELERKYRNVHSTGEDAATVTAPRLDHFSSTFPGPTRLVKHGERTLAIASMMHRVASINEGKVQRFKDNLRLSDLTETADHLIGESAVVASENVNYESDDADLPALPALRRGGKAATTSKSRTTAAAAADKRRTKKSRGRGTSRARRNDSSDMEGNEESEPEPTPANMRIATQGIELGSEDTSNDERDGDGEEEQDSQLEGFVVGSDVPIELVSSSLPRMRGEESRSEDEDEDDEEGDVQVVEEEVQVHVRRRLERRKRLVVDDSE